MPEDLDTGPHEVAAALRSARSAWAEATSEAAAACGMDVVTAAHTRLRDAWSAEIGAHLDVLDQAADEGAR